MRSVHDYGNILTYTKYQVRIQRRVWERWPFQISKKNLRSGSVKIYYANLVLIV